MGRKRALISVYKKDGLDELADQLISAGYEIISSGGTAATLEKRGVPVTKVEDVTGFPELLGGRVKTLHPAVHGGILARDTETDRTELDRHNIAFIDIVVVNLYPFEEVPVTADLSELVEMIDIGGVALIRAAAKNFERVSVLTSPEDYGDLVTALKTGKISVEQRRQWAVKAFQRTKEYDRAIELRLANRLLGDVSPVSEVTVELSRGERLRYGENPHQEASLFATERSCGLASSIEILHGKEMSYNNYLDVYSAVLPHFHFDQPLVTVMKHMNPCGIAIHSELSLAFEFAWEGDSKSAFGSVVALNRELDLATAEKTRGRFIEVIIAPSFSPDALEFLKKKSSQLRIIKADLDTLKSLTKEYHGFMGIMLVTSRDCPDETEWKTVTSNPFPDALAELVRFGIVSCAVVKSNAVSLVCKTPDAGGLMQIGMGSGQPNRVDAFEKLAIPKALDNCEKLFGKRELPEETILVSEAFFPFSDVVETASRFGIRYIVQPGGAKRDQEVIDSCDRSGISMIFTGRRHFRHF